MIKGVCDTHQAQILDSLPVAPGGQSVTSSAFDTFMAAANAGIPLDYLDSTGINELDQLPIAADAQALITQELLAGDIVLDAHGNGHRAGRALDRLVRDQPDDGSDDRRGRKRVARRIRRLRRCLRHRRGQDLRCRLGGCGNGSIALPRSTR